MLLSKQNWNFTLLQRSINNCCKRLRYNSTTVFKKTRWNVVQANGFLVLSPLSCFRKKLSVTLGNWNTGRRRITGKLELLQAKILHAEATELLRESTSRQLTAFVKYLLNGLEIERLSLERLFSILATVPCYNWSKVFSLFPRKPYCHDHPPRWRACYKRL